VDWYRAQFVGATSQSAVGEATPNYLHHPDAIRRMAQVIPNARLIAVLRNPLDRAYSAYWHRRALGREPRGFEEALEGEPRTGGGDPQDSYAERSRYIEALRRVGESFPREALHVLLFEDLTERPADTYREVCRFLLVDDQFLPGSLGIPFNAFVGFRWLRLRHLGKRVPGWAGRILGRLNSVRGIAYPPLDPATRARLAYLFKEDNRALAQFLGRDLTVWEESGADPEKPE
ncbi:MAG: sulfotransferase, partial [Acidimicrobiia bacterium]